MPSLTSPRTLGFVFVAWGILNVLAVAAMVTLFSMPWFEGDTWRVPSLTSPLALFAAVGTGGAALSLFAGISLIRSARWAKPLGLVASVISLPTVPIGTAIGVYGLVILLGSGGPKPTGDAGEPA